MQSINLFVFQFSALEVYHAKYTEKWWELIFVKKVCVKMKNLQSVSKKINCSLCWYTMFNLISLFWYNVFLLFFFFQILTFYSILKKKSRVVNITMVCLSFVNISLTWVHHKEMVRILVHQNDPNYLFYAKIVYL